MNRLLQRPILAVLAASLSLTVAGTTRAAPVRVPRSAITIYITQTSGTVWGTVTAAYTFKQRAYHRSLTAAKSTLTVPNGVKLHLSQTPTNASSWPFKKWTVTHNHKTNVVMSSSTTVKVAGKMSITAVYVLSQSGYTSPGY